MPTTVIALLHWTVEKIETESWNWVRFLLQLRWRFTRSSHFSQAKEPPAPVSPRGWGCWGAGGQGDAHKSSNPVCCCCTAPRAPNVPDGSSKLHGGSREITLWIPDKSSFERHDHTPNPRQHWARSPLQSFPHLLQENLYTSQWNPVEVLPHRFWCPTLAFRRHLYRRASPGRPSAHPPIWGGGFDSKFDKLPQGAPAYFFLKMRPTSGRPAGHSWRPHKRARTARLVVTSPPAVPACTKFCSVHLRSISTSGGSNFPFGSLPFGSTFWLISICLSQMCSITTQRLNRPSAHNEQLFAVWNNKDCHHGNSSLPAVLSSPSRLLKGTIIWWHQRQVMALKKINKSKGGKRPRADVTEVGNTHTSPHTLQEPLQNQQEQNHSL